MANYVELQKREDGEANALIKREDWNKIIMEILEWHDSEFKKLNIPVVMVELPCDEEIEQQSRKVNEGDIDYGYVFGAKWMRGLAKGN
jgi:hypothetical protein